MLRRAGDLLSAGKEALARAMTREMGKVLTETRGDVQEAIDTAYYAASEGRRLFGRTVPSELKSKWAMTYRRPVGVAGIITPFNFPVAIPSHLPFGGVKQTGNGHREGGWQLYDFYSETKAIYVDYSGRLQRAQIDTYG